VTPGDRGLVSVAFTTNPGGSGGMGVYARALSGFLESNCSYRLLDEGKEPAPARVDEELAICHGWSQHGYRTFASASFARGITDERERNVLLVPFDATFLHSDPLEEIHDTFGILWVDSEISAQRLRAAGFTSSPIEVIPPPSSALTPRSAVSRDDSAYRLIHVANGDPYVKGTDLALQAIATAIPECPGATLTIVLGGEGRDFRIAMELVKAHAPHCRESVRIIRGPVPRAAMSALYAESHCCLVCSRTETFGLPVLEAARAGIPVILHRQIGAADHRQCFLHSLCAGEWRPMHAGAWRENQPSSWFEVDTADVAIQIGRLYRERPLAPPAQADLLEGTFGRASFERAMHSALHRAIGSPASYNLPSGAIAQLEERLLCKQEVAGSIPAGSTSR
jgi:hypothetical protein